jgi:hypothetical protein
MKKYILLAAAIGLLSTQSQAQWYANHYVPPVWIPNIHNGGIFIPLEQDDDEGPDTDTQVVSSVDLRFKISASQRKQNIANFINEVAKVTPDYAPRLASELADGSIVKQYEQLVTSLGLDPNNVADNMAAWMLTAWEASAGRPLDIQPSDFVTVKQQMQNMLSTSEAAGFSNAEKQKVSDDLIMRTMVIANQIEYAKTNPEFAKQLAISTKKSVKQSGLDFDKMTLTEDGFVPAKGRKRSEPSAATAEGSYNYALIAGAAGAGLGLAFLIGKAVGKRGEGNQVFCSPSYSGVI